MAGALLAEVGVQIVEEDTEQLGQGSLLLGGEAGDEFVLAYEDTVDESLDEFVSSWGQVINVSGGARTTR